LTSRLPLRSIAAGRGGAPSVAAPVPPAAALEQVLTVADQVLATPPAAGPARAPTPGDVLVLSGGGMFGAAQAGMLAALCEQTQWCREVIVGVSAGALNGTWLAHDFSAAHAAGLVEIWRGFTGRGVFPARAVSQVFNVIACRDAVQDGAA